MREHDRNDDNLIEALFRSNRVSASKFEDALNKLPGAPILKHVTQVPNNPQQGMFIVDPTRAPELPGWCFYLGDRWYCIYPRDPVHAIKVFPDKKSNKIETGAFRFTVEKDLADHAITFAEGFNGTPGSGATTFVVRNQTRGINIVTVTINSGAEHSNGSITIDEGGDPLDPNHLLHWKDMIYITTTAVGSGSKGLGAYLTHSPWEFDPN